LKVNASDVSDNQVSAAWGGAVTRRAARPGRLPGCGARLSVVRFEWRMAVAAVSSLLLDLVLTAGVYSLVGFE